MDGSAYIYQGIRDGASAFADGVREYQKNRQESQFLDAQLDMMMKFAPEYGVSVDPDEMVKYSSGNLNAKRAAVTGLAMQMQMAQEKSKHEEMKRYRDEQLGIQRQRLALDEMALQAKTAGETEDAIEHEFIEDPETGSRFLGRGRTTLPSGVNPQKVKAPDAQEVKDDEGNVIFHALPTGKGGWTFRPVDKDTSPKQFIDPDTMKPVPGVFVIGKQIKDLRNEMQKLGVQNELEETATKPPADKAKDPKPTPATSAKRFKFDAVKGLIPAE